MTPLQKTIDYLIQNKKVYLADLAELVKIPSVSFPGFDPEILQDSAEAVLKLLQDRGFQNTQILQIEGAFPAVYGEILVDEKTPTLLLYAHHDVQPPGDENLWYTPPFLATENKGRLYGRGTADDKGGIVIHTSAIHCWLQTHKTLPLNVKIFIEGEEEYGSTHLSDYLEKYASLLKADVLILTDTANIETGIPSITTSLRGLVALDVTVKALDHALHSGVWGGALPDPAMALSKILASCTNIDGTLAIDGIYDDVPRVSDLKKQHIKELPITPALFKEQAKLISQASLFDQGHPLELTWYQPSLIVNAIQASSKHEARNIICDSAWARIGLRVVSGMDPQKTLNQIKDHIQQHTPWNLEVLFDNEIASGGWESDTNHSCFNAALKALEQGFQKKAVMIGCGATIPFVEPFSKQMGGIPALLIGIEDPYSNAHGENESLDLDDFYKAIRAAIFMYQELSTTL